MFTSPAAWALIAVAAVFLTAVALFAIYGFGSVAQRKRGVASLALPVRPDQTVLDRAIAPLLDRHEEESGLALLTSSLQAFRARLETARGAGRSLDLQYYYWK